MFRNTLRKKMIWVSILILLSSSIVPISTVFADEIENTSEGNEINELYGETEETITEIISKEDIELFENVLLNKNEGGMYTVVQTIDGRIIQSSATMMNDYSRATGNVHGEVISVMIAGVLYEGIKITIDGKGALCIDQDLCAPFEPNVPYDNGSPFQNDGVLAILSHGAYGPVNPNPSDEEIICTEIALRNWLTGNITINQAVSNSHPYIADLIEKAKMGDYIQQSFDFSKQNVEAEMMGDRQVSETITTSGNAIKYVDIPVPSDIILHNLSTGTQTTNGNARIYGGQSFNMSASLSYDKKYNSGSLVSAFGKPVALMFTPFDAGYQRLMQGKFDDPQQILPISVNFFARLGNAEFQKLSEVSDLPMAGVTYRVQEQGKAPYEMKTDQNGLLVFNDRIHGTTIDVTEIDNPLGYVLDTSMYRLVINGGKTVSQTLTNQIQRGRFSGVKYAEVFDEKETWEIGEPVYEDVPVEGREFDVVAMNDILLPDRQTVVVQAGTVVDHVKTDAEGKFASNVDLYIGEQNKYKLVETNVPDDYRQPSDVQTEFSIPYGENTVALLFYDTGIIDNKLKKGDIIFNKKNALLPDLGLNLGGATFLVQGLSPQVKHVQFTFTTEMTPTQLNLLAGYGTADYLFTEVEFPNGIGQSNGTPQTQIVRVIDGEEMVIDWNNTPLTPEIRSLFTTVDGEKVIDPTIDNVVVDEVQGSGFLKDTPILVDSEFVVVDENNQFVRSLGHIEEVYTFESSSISFSVEHELEKDTVTHGEKIVATHTFYNEEKTVDYAKDYDLSNSKQTITTEKAKEETPNPPEVPTPTPTKQGVVSTTKLPVAGESPMVFIRALGLFLFTFWLMLSASRN